MGDSAMVTGLLIAGLVYVLVTCVLGTLASRIKYACHRHDLVVEARQRRQAYLRKLKDGDDEDLELV